MERADADFRSRPSPQGVHRRPLGGAGERWRGARHHQSGDGRSLRRVAVLRRSRCEPGRAGGARRVRGIREYAARRAARDARARDRCLHRAVAGYGGRHHARNGRADGRHFSPASGGTGALAPSYDPGSGEAVSVRTHPGHVADREGAGGGVRVDHAMELADEPGLVQGGAGAGGGLHDRVEAESECAVLGDCSRRDPREGRRTSRRIQSRAGPGSAAGPSRPARSSTWCR